MMEALKEVFPVYLCMSLHEESLSEIARTRLEKLGVEEISDGKPYVALRYYFSY